MNSLIESNEINNIDKNNLFIIFLDKLMTLYNQEEYDKIKNILIGNKQDIEYKYSHKNGNSTYYDEGYITTVRVWADEETKKQLDCLYYVCTDENTIISLNNKIIEMWLHILNYEMSKVFYNIDNKKTVECSKDHRMYFTIQNKKWSDFTKKCKTLGITINIGFKDCVNKYLDEKSNINI